MFASGRNDRRQISSNERDIPYRRAVAATCRGARKLSRTILSFSSSDHRRDLCTQTPPSRYSKDCDDNCAGAKLWRREWAEVSVRDRRQGCPNALREIRCAIGGPRRLVDLGALPQFVKLQRRVDPA